MHTFRLFFGFLMAGWGLTFNPALAQTSDLLPEPPLPKSGLVVIAYQAKGLSISDPASTPEQDWIRMHWMSLGGGAAPWVAYAVSGDRKRSKQRKAMRAALDGFDHDALDQRLLNLVRCQIPKARVLPDAPVREWAFFGSSSARHLGAYTPGSVLVLQINAEFNPQLDELRFRVDELHFRFFHRAKSAAELKRLPKDEAAKHKPEVTVVNVHEYRYRIGAGGVNYSVVNGKDSLEAQFADGHGPSPTELRVAQTVSVKPDKYGYHQMGAIWAADGGALLHEQVEAGLQVLEASLHRAGGLGCVADGNTH